MAKKNEKKYQVECSCIYNVTMFVKATSEEDALEKASEMLDSDGLKDFPDSVNVPNGSFIFGEATADYADEVDDENDNMSPDSDIVSDQCASGVVREYDVLYCNKEIFGDEEEHKYDVDCADGAAVAHAKNEKDPQILFLTYPKMAEVVKNEDMVDDIRDYRGLPYDEKIHYGDIMMFCGKIVARM